MKSKRALITVSRYESKMVTAVKSTVACDGTQMQMEKFGKTLQLYSNTL